MAEQSPPERYQAAAARWCGRLALERGASLAQLRLAVAACELLPEHPAGIRVLRALCEPSAPRTGGAGGRRRHTARRKLGDRTVRSDGRPYLGRNTAPAPDPPMPSDRAARRARDAVDGGLIRLPAGRSGASGAKRCRCSWSRCWPPRAGRTRRTRERGRSRSSSTASAPNGASTARRGWCVRSRPGRDCSEQFPELAALARSARRRRVILDGELVHFADDGRPDFAAMHRRLTAPAGLPAAARGQRGAPPSWSPSTCCTSTAGLPERSLPRPPRPAEGDRRPAGERWRLAPAWTERLEDRRRGHARARARGRRVQAPRRGYRPGRRAAAWRKLEHRRHTRSSSLAWRPGEREPTPYYLARRGRTARHGLRRSRPARPRPRRRERLRTRCANAKPPARDGNDGSGPSAPGVSVVVSGHGPPGPLRDAIIRETCSSTPTRAEPRPRRRCARGTPA